MKRTRTAKIPKNYQTIRNRYPELGRTLDKLGATLRQLGPLDDKTAHLVQLAAAAASRSEGAVHSHARRASEAGATSDEIRHTVVLLTSTIGFPAVAAALSWVDDVVK